MKFNREREIKNNTFVTKISFKEFGGDAVYSAEDEARLVDDFGYPEVEIGFIKGTYEVETKEGKKHIRVTPSDDTVDRFHFGKPEVIVDEEAVKKVVALQDTAFDQEKTFFNVGFKLEIGYENIKSVEIRLYNEGRIIAYSNGIVEGLKKVDEEYGGIDGQLSCPFPLIKEAESDEYWHHSTYDLTNPEKVQVRIIVDEDGQLKEYIAERIISPSRSASKEIVVCSHFRGCKKVDEKFSVVCRLPIKNDEGKLCDPSVLSSEKLSEYEAKCRLFEETIIKRIHLALQDLYAKDTVFEIEEGDEIVVSVNQSKKPSYPDQADTHENENIFIG